MVESEICIRERASAMLIHPDYEGRVTQDWFNAATWGDQARPVSSGGRGGAWFLQAGEDKLVLREYRRGGLVAKFARYAYAFTREADVRSFAEFRLLNAMLSKGLPVPRPVAAWYRKLSPIQYRAAIIIERLENTSPLADLIAELDGDAWESIGETIRRFHDAGVMHADLNCFNVLVRGDEYFLIDFDKSRLTADSAPARWKEANLDRFSRSLVKVAGEHTRAKVWSYFMNGYNRGMAA
ncbi:MULTISPECIES: 3-deoxy-D-manno-octulosonic acid kinase [Marinobacter]|jgi:3-deoxy-D-manno-octulosonic acid kinase|nr:MULTISPECIES: 3-deoxy-D-manno-octulosonic acid kinase [Marinobacter]MBO6812456.1 3-deoxy-D-manno-octulosonic acid kinase [Marinobacter sp.]MBO6874081.1 3-deoxy-D-manno-octulosonic acid kinase [Marinobacter sp.]|tara:strand:- start:1990 stop:2706 length:717 start_codon:yes stop_codon:yes gene_type:complete